MGLLAGLLKRAEAGLAELSGIHDPKDLVLECLPDSAKPISLSYVSHSLRLRYANAHEQPHQSKAPRWALEQAWGNLLCSSTPSIKEDTNRFWDDIVTSGDLEILKRLQAMSGGWYGDTFGYAAAHGHLHILQWALASGCPTKDEGAWAGLNLSQICSCAAAMNGHIEVLQWLDSVGLLDTSERLGVAAALAQQPMELVQWAHGRSTSGKAVCATAAERGELAVLKWLKEKACPWDEHVCNAAALHGHLDILKWAHSNSCPFGKDVCTVAAVAGRLDILQWAYSKAACDAAALNDVAMLAATNGALDMLQWARSKGCAWDASMTTMAAYFGQLEVLDWLVSSGCPARVQREELMRCAALRGHLHILKWARSQGPPYGWDELVAARAALGGHVEVLQWLLDNGCPWDRVTLDIVKQKKLPVVFPRMRRFLIMQVIAPVVLGSLIGLGMLGITLLVEGKCVVGEAHGKGRRADGKAKPASK